MYPTNHGQATTLFELPPDEIQLMQQVTSEIQKARRWAFLMQFLLLGQETWVILEAQIKAFECQRRNGYMLIDG